MDFAETLYFLSSILIFSIAAIIVRRIEKNNIFVRVFLISYPIIFLMLVFSALYKLMPYYVNQIYDSMLAKIDFVIFDFHPTVAIENLVTPVLTEIFYFFYLLYFPLPFFIIIYLIIKKKKIELDKALFFMTLVYYGSYIMYFLVPALGPRFFPYINSLQSVKIEGVWLADSIKVIINNLEKNKFDAFPSLHAAITLATVIVMGQYRPKWLWIFIPVTYIIFVSLIYLRYHYFIDVIVGVIWTLICFWISEKFHNRLFRKYFRIFY